MSKKMGRLYCFSPPVMIAAFTVETTMLIYVTVRYKMNATARLVAATLALLAIFQLAEYHVCRYSGLVTLASRTGFIAITLLPPVAIHLIFSISKRQWKLLTMLAYLSAAVFIVTFGFRATAFSGYVCAGNYAIFQLAPSLGGEFFTYYYFWLLSAICTSLYFAISAAKLTREALIYQVFGILSFMIPTGIVNAVNPSTIRGIPSIMCGFAVIYAIVLTFGIAPFTLRTRRPIKAKEQKQI